MVHQLDTHKHAQKKQQAIDGGTAGSIKRPAASDRTVPDRVTLRIQGMDCAEEVEILRREVGPLVGGGEHLEFDILNGRMHVPIDGQARSVDQIRAAVARTGMRAELDEPHRTTSLHEEDHRRRTQTILTGASGMCILVAVVLQVSFSGSLAGTFEAGAGGVSRPGIPAASLLAYAAAIVLAGRYVIVKALYAARRLRPDMNLLMVIAVIGAAGLNDWLEAATVAFLFALSLSLESWSVGRARNAISALLKLTPSVARLVDVDGSTREVPATQVAIGARFLVKPGERIALDGRVLSGTSEVNQAPITGESIPVPKSLGSDAFAGTINGDGVLTIESTKAASDTTLARIIKLVEAAQSRRSPSEQWVEKFAKVYTPVVILLAIAVAVAPPLLLGGGWAIWFYRSLVLLVIACPCALVISTPVTIVAALTGAARAGVLVKGGAYIEIPGRLRSIAFDKTGTLTLGRPAVRYLQPFSGHSEEDLLARAAALEAHSNHPLARAITEFATSHGVTPIPAANVQSLLGKGVTGSFNGRSFWLGSHRYLEERLAETPELHEQAQKAEAQGCTVIVIGNNTHVCGIIAVADAPRPEAARTIQALRRLGIDTLVMLTGDNRTTAQSLGRQVGIEEIRAELLPPEKVDVIETLSANFGPVAMVGDGVNDAPAMASANLGIAMGAAGTDAAIEAADIALMSDDLSKLPWLVRHSRRTLSIVRQNIAFSLAVKAAFMVMTLSGLASLWGAIAADTGASLLVVANGLRLLRSSHGTDIAIPIRK